MKRVSTIIAVLLLSLRILFAGDGIRVQESLSFYSIILKQEVKYSVCLPEDYFKTKMSFPVVYLLHGLGDDESSWLEYGRISQISDALVKSKEIVPMIFIMPQGFRNYYVNDYAGTFLYQDMFVKELVPLIDSLYRTIPDKQHRATLGYSMGGFGALVLPLKHPELFSAAVPLSISIRTDEQYKIEDGSEWDQQWGRLFGGVGMVGEDRLTPYYKENSPFHIIENADLQTYKGLRIYIDNGDDENTLCRSNEELHILMRNKSFPHEFRVRNGGHEFEFWREALPNGLRFISDCFKATAYRGDIRTFDPPKKDKQVKLLDNELFSVVLPQEYAFSIRNFPALYFMGDFSLSEKTRIGDLVFQQIRKGNLAPMILVFPKAEQGDESIMPVIAEAEKLYRIRKGYRFRAVISYGKSGSKAMQLCLDSLRFTSCSVFNGTPNYRYAENVLKTADKKVKSRTWYYINAPDKSINFTQNGRFHILLRESDFYHEYRVTEGSGGFEWFLSGLSESLIFTQEKIHK